jgi:hypothetical protein
MAGRIRSCSRDIVEQDGQPVLLNRHDDAGPPLDVSYVRSVKVAAHRRMAEPGSGEG